MILTLDDPNNLKDKISCTKYQLLYLIMNLLCRYLANKSLKMIACFRKNLSRWLK
jgi:hypothetical protein